MSKAKSASVYTDEQVAEMIGLYNAAENDDERAVAVETLAKRFGTKPQSVRMKLVREGVYVAKSYKTKSGDRPVTKETLVTEIGEAIGTDDELIGLERAAKNTLFIILRAVTRETETSE